MWKHEGYGAVGCTSCGAMYPALQGRVSKRKASLVVSTVNLGCERCEQHTSAVKMFAGTYHDMLKFMLADGYARVRVKFWFDTYLSLFHGFVPTRLHMAGCEFGPPESQHYDVVYAFATECVRVLRSNIALSSRPPDEVESLLLERVGRLHTSFRQMGAQKEINAALLRSGLLVHPRGESGRGSPIPSAEPAVRRRTRRME